MYLFSLDLKFYLKKGGHQTPSSCAVVCYVSSLQIYYSGIACNVLDLYLKYFQVSDPLPTFDDELILTVSDWMRNRSVDVNLMVQYEMVRSA